MPINMPEDLSNKIIDILHISDIHFKEEKWKLSRTKITTEFIKTVNRHIEASDKKPDVLIIAGDIVWTGIKDEYALAITFITDLIDKINNKELRLYIVPGNHDVIRAVAEKDTVQYNVKRKWEKVLENEHVGGGKRFKERFAGYYHFLRELRRKVKVNFPEINHEYFFTDTFIFKGCSISVLGLNSAWSCEDDEDEGSIILGEYQAFTASQTIPNTGKPCDLSIALMHHPFSSFHHADSEARDVIRQNCELLFRGHTHKGSAVGLKIDGIALHELTTSAIFLAESDTDDAGLKSGTEEVGFQFVKIDLQKGYYYIWPYIWKNKHFFTPNERSAILQDKGFIPMSFRGNIFDSETSKDKALEQKGHLNLDATVGNLSDMVGDAYAEILQRVKYIQDRDFDAFGFSLHNLDTHIQGASATAATSAGVL